MFYNYLIFSIVALSLRIFKKHFVSKNETLIFQVQNKSFSCNKLFIRSLSSTHRCLPRNKRKFYFHSITKNNDVYKYQSSGEYWHFFSEKQIKSYKISL